MSVSGVRTGKGAEALSVEIEVEVVRSPGRE
jgi:hypothetical protein